jgi:hypothetical protein
VVGIGSYAFLVCNTLSGNLTFPKSITTIGLSAFEGCVGLNSVSTPGSGNAENISIGSYAFNSCSITSADFTNTTKKVTIGSYAFLSCTSLTTAKFSDLYKEDNSDSIGSNAFEGCMALTLFSTGGDSDITIGNYAFYGCVLLNDLEFADSEISFIGSYAFHGCAALTVTNIAMLPIDPSIYEKVSNFSGVAIFKTTDNAAYESGCLYVGNITNIATDPIQKATTIGSNAFEGCASLTDVSFSNTSISSSSIGSYAFYGCAKLKNVTFANTTTATFGSDANIGYYAFRDCAVLENIIFPKVVSGTIETQSISEFAFYGCAHGGHIVFSNES